MSKKLPLCLLSLAPFLFPAVIELIERRWMQGGLPKPFLPCQQEIQAVGSLHPSQLGLPGSFYIPLVPLHP